MTQKDDIKIENSLVPWMGKTMKLIDNKIEDLLLENNIDLTKNQFIILKNIEFNEGLSQNELAFFANRNKSTLARMIAVLERKKYINKQYCQHDGRKCKISISPLGKKVLLQASPYLSNFVATIQNGISENHKKIMMDTLNKIQDNIIGSGPTPFFKETK